MDWTKTAKSGLTDEQVLVISSGLTPAPDPAIRMDVWRAILMLAPRPLLVMILRYWQGMTLKEVGKYLEVSPERIRQIEAKAIRFLRNHLAGRRIFWRQQKDTPIFAVVYCYELEKIQPTKEADK